MRTINIGKIENYRITDGTKVIFNTFENVK
jgi:hypothetical protein